MIERIILKNLIIYLGVIAVGFMINIMGAVFLTRWLVYLGTVTIGIILQNKKLLHWTAFWWGLIFDLFWEKRVGGSSLLFLAIALALNLISERFRQKKSF